MAYKLLSLACVLGASFLLTACETTSSSPYKASTQNVIGLKSTLASRGATVRLAEFTSASGVPDKPMCRGLGPVDVAPGKTLPQFVREAMQEELFLAGAYDDAANVAVRARIDAVEMDSFGTGAWRLTMTVSSDRDPSGYQVSTDYPFASSFSAISACRNAANAFGPAVQDLLGKVVRDRRFAQLAGA